MAVHPHPRQTGGLVMNDELGRLTQGMLNANGASLEVDGLVSHKGSPYMKDSATGQALDAYFKKLGDDAPLGNNDAGLVKKMQRAMGRKPTGEFTPADEAAWKKYAEAHIAPVTPAPAPVATVQAPVVPSGIDPQMVISDLPKPQPATPAFAGAEHPDISAAVEDASRIRNPNPMLSAMQVRARAAGITVAAASQTSPVVPVSRTVAQAPAAEKLTATAADQWLAGEQVASTDRAATIRAQLATANKPQDKPAVTLTSSQTSSIPAAEQKIALQTSPATLANLPEFLGPSVGESGSFKEPVQVATQQAAPDVVTGAKKIQTVTARPDGSTAPAESTVAGAVGLPHNVEPQNVIIDSNNTSPTIMSEQMAGFGTLMGATPKPVPAVMVEPQGPASKPISISAQVTALAGGKVADMPDYKPAPAIVTPKVPASVPSATTWNPATDPLVAMLDNMTPSDASHSMPPASVTHPSDAIQATSQTEVAPMSLPAGRAATQVASLPSQTVIQPENPIEISGQPTRRAGRTELKTKSAQASVAPAADVSVVAAPQVSAAAVQAWEGKTFYNTGAQTLEAQVFPGNMPDRMPAAAAQVQTATAAAPAAASPIDAGLPVPDVSPFYSGLYPQNPGQAADKWYANLSKTVQAPVDQPTSPGTSNFAMNAPHASYRVLQTAAEPPPVTAAPDAGPATAVAQSKPAPATSKPATAPKIVAAGLFNF